MNISDLIKARSLDPKPAPENENEDKIYFRGTEVKAILVQDTTGERELNCVEVYSEDVAEAVRENILGSYVSILLSEPVSVKLTMSDKSSIQLEENDYYEVGYRAYSVDIDPSIILGIIKNASWQAVDIELTEEQKKKIIIETTETNEFEENYEEKYQSLIQEIFGEEEEANFTY